MTKDKGQEPEEKKNLPEKSKISRRTIIKALAGLPVLGFFAYKVLEKKGAPAIKQLFTVGGGTRNKKWMQYRSEQLDSEVIIPEYTEACFGTALLAKQGFNKKTE